MVENNSNRYVNKLDLNGNFLDAYENAAVAAKKNRTDPSAIIKVLKGKRISAGGFKWAYGAEKTKSNQDNNISRNFSENKTSEYSDNSATLSASTRKSITSKEEAIEFFKVDINQWDVKRYICNSWDVTNGDGITYTNYQVKLFLEKKKFTLEEEQLLIDEILKPYVPKQVSKTNEPLDKTISVNLSDFHIGAEIRDLVRTPDFDVHILIEYLQKCVDKINEFKAKKVVLNLTGDYFESLSGMNHINTFKSLGKNMWGANVIILANELISTHLISKINNINSINLIGGNHDRMTADNKLDNTGEGAKLLAYMLQKDFPNIPIDFNSTALIKNIDGINYILTHGDKSFSKKDAAKVIFDYGDSSIFNLWIEGHKHTRETKKAFKTNQTLYHEVDSVSLDELKYRKIVLPALFTGNYYSESLGYAGTAGFVITENNGSGYPNVYDFTIN